MRVRADITTDGKYVLAYIPWAGGHGAAWAKSVPGCKSRYEEGKFVCWQYPLSMDTCRTFRRLFGSQLSVRKPLSEWAREQIAAGDTLDELRSGATIDFPRLQEEAPFLAAAINSRPYQVSGAAFIKLGRTVILGDAPGLGKTLQAAAAIIESDCRDILVGCPRTATRATWEREIERWCPTISTFVAQGGPEQRYAQMEAFALDREENPDERRILIVNNEMIRARKMWRCKEPPPDRASDYELVKVPGKRKPQWSPELQEWSKEPGSDGGCTFGHQHEKFNEYQWPFLFEQCWDAIIIDESHNILASQYNVQSKHITQSRYGAMLLRKQLKPGGIALALSATPARAKLTRFWGPLNWCAPKVFSSFWNFAGTHFGVTEGKYGNVIANGDKVPQPRDMVAWHAMLQPYYLVRDKKSAAPDLPDAIYTGTPHPSGGGSGNYVYIDMEGDAGNKQARAYQQMKKYAEARVKNGNLSAVGILAEITRLRQFSVSYGKMDGEEFQPAFPSNKWDWILNFLEEHEGDEGKYLIASNFTRVVNLFRSRFKRLGIESIELTGATSDQARAKFMQRFNDIDDTCKVGLINTRAGGVSLTLDAACDDIIIVDPPWTSDEEDQLVGRVHRVSRIHQVFVHRLVSVGSIEEWMSLHGQEQREVLSQANPKARRDAAMEVIRWPS